MISFRIHSLHLISFSVIFFLSLKSIAQKTSSDFENSLIGENDTTRVLFLLRRAQKYQFSDPDSALYYVDRANKINTEKFLNGRIKMANTLGNIAWGRSDYLEALHQYNNLLDLTMRSEDSVMISKSYNNLGSVFYRMGMMQEAADHYFKALEIKERIGASPKSIAMSYNNIGSTYDNIGDKQYAKELLTKAVEIRRQIGDSLGLSDTYHNLARLYRDEENFESAEQYFKDAVLIKTELNNLRGLANTLNSLGNLYEIQGRVDSAEFYYNKSIEVAKESSSGYELVQAFISQANLFFTQGRLDEALVMVRGWEKILPSISTWLLKVDANILKSQIYESLNKQDSALHYYRIYVAARDSLASQENKNYINKLKWQYETEKKELLIQDQERKITFSYIIALATVVLLVLIINRLFAQRKINRLNKERFDAEVDYKNRLLASRTMDINNFENLLNDLKEQIDQTSKETPEKLATNLKKAIKHKLKDVNDWGEVKMHFEEVHPRFFEKVSKIQPSLTPNEQKHFAYIKMKISNKEIARMLNVNLASIHVVHHRIKKKLGLSENESLAEYVDQL